MTDQYNLELEIQDLVLTDIAVNDPQELKQAISIELSRLFEQDGIPSRLSQSPQKPIINAGPMETVQSPSMHQFGISIAQAIYQGLGK